MRNTTRFITAALALAGALGAGAAQANSDVSWSVTIGSPVYGRTAPVYVPRAPVFVQPAPVVVRQAPVVVQRGYVHPTRWDRDGDGIPNRHDRLYNPRWDRDGDGVPNRYDRNDHRNEARFGSRH